MHFGASRSEVPSTYLPWALLVYVQLTSCTGVPRPCLYSHYYDPLCGGGIKMTFRGLRKKAASLAGSASGPARSFRTRGRVARQEPDDGSCALGARYEDDIGTRRCPCAQMIGDLIVVHCDFLTHYAIPQLSSSCVEHCNSSWGNTPPSTREAVNIGSRNFWAG